MSQSSVEPFRIDDQISSFQDKNPGRLHVTFFVFPQWSDVSLDIIVTIENMKNDVPFAVCKRYPFPTGSTTTPCERRVALT